MDLRRLRDAFITAVPDNKREALVQFLQEPIPHSKNDENEIQKRFSKFRKEEVKISERPAEHLVSPSGTLSAPLGLFLHWPTFTGIGSLENGTVAEYKNPCMRLLLRKGFDPVNCLWLDRYSRRANKVKSSKPGTVPMDSWSSELRGIHEAFSENTMNDSRAKVWVIFGSRNKAWYRSMEHRWEETAVEIPDSDVRTSAHLEYDENDSIRRVVIFCQHPESIFYPNQRQPRKGLEMDAALNLAAALTQLRIHTAYFERFYQGLISNRKDVQGQMGHLPVTGYDGEAIPLDLVETVMEDLAKEDPDSPIKYEQLNPRLRKWLHDQNVVDQSAADKWRSQFQGNQQTLLTSLFTQCIADIDAVADLPTDGQGKDDRAGYKKRLNNKYGVIQRAPDPARGDPLSLQVHCRKCKTVKTDYFPTFMIADGAYRVRKLPCRVCPAKKRENRYKDHYPVANIKRVTYRIMRAAFFDAYPNDVDAKKYRDSIAKEKANKEANAAKYKEAKAKKAKAKSETTSQPSAAASTDT